MEIHTSEIQDPEHLPLELQNLIKEIADLIESGSATIEDFFENTEDADDPILRALVNGQVLNTLGLKVSYAADVGYNYPKDRGLNVVQCCASGQHSENMHVFEDSGLYNPDNPREGDVRPPTENEIEQLFVANATPEQLTAIGEMKQGWLQLIPITSSKRYLEALKKLRNSRGLRVSKWTQKLLEQMDERDGITDDRIIGWRVAITEEGDTMDRDPFCLHEFDTEQRLDKVLEWFDKEYGTKGVSGLDLRRYLLLQMFFDFLQRSPIWDFHRRGRGNTIINSEPFLDGKIAQGRCAGTPSEIFMNGAHTNQLHKRVGIYPSVMFDVPNPEFADLGE